MLGESQPSIMLNTNEGVKRNTYLIQRFEQTYIQKQAISLSKRLLKTRQQEAPNQTKTEQRPSETPWNKGISGNINYLQLLLTLIHNSVDKSVNLCKLRENYRLTWR